MFVILFNKSFTGCWMVERIGKLLSHPASLRLLISKTVLRGPRTSKSLSNNQNKPFQFHSQGKSVDVSNPECQPKDDAVQLSVRLFLTVCVLLHSPSVCSVSATNLSITGVGKLLLGQMWTFNLLNKVTVSSRE